MYKKLDEKFQSEEEVKNIISELKMKIKDLEYLFRKQWQVLKRFNLQEKIYREESKNLTESEKLKRDEIYKETIEKLTAAHVGGFEPAAVIKNKILNKIQQKFKITELVMSEFKRINYDSYFSREAKENKTEFISEERLLKKRHEDQVDVLEKFIRVNFLVPNKDNRFRDRDREYDTLHNYHQNKMELKRYEKEIEMKAGKGGYAFILDNSNEDEYKFKFENNLNLKRNSTEREKANSIFEQPQSSNKSNLNSINSYSNLTNNNEEYNVSKFNADSMIVDDDQNEYMINTESYFSNKYDKNIKIKEIFKISDGENIQKFKDKVIEELKEKAAYNKDIYEDSLKTQNFVYKSKILNDLFVRLNFIY